MCGALENETETVSDEDGRGLLLALLTEGKPYVLVTATMAEEDDAPTIRVETNAGSEEFDEVAAWMLVEGSKVFVK